MLAVVCSVGTLMLIAHDPRGDGMLLHLVAAEHERAITTLCGQEIPTCVAAPRHREIDAEVARVLCFGCAGRAKIDACKVIMEAQCPGK